MYKQLVLGIDAHNIRAGGGITYLSEMLAAAHPEKFGFHKVIVWSGKKTLNQLPQRKWLSLQSHSYLNKSLFFRLLWLFFIRNRALRRQQCDLLFVPGGTDFFYLKPMVTMSQNLLPFEMQEVRRYGISLNMLKFMVLRFIQSYTFKKAQGVLFLTGYAENAVKKVTGQLDGLCTIVAHGIHPKFFREPDERSYQSIQSFTIKNPCKLIYVSVVEIYKHQWHVIRGVKILRDKGYHVDLTLIGPAGPGMPLLYQAINELKGDTSWVHYLGAIPYDKIQDLYGKADVGIFASSCETYGQIVSEAMAASLPIVCSNLSAMKDVLGAHAVYFHPEKPEEIANALQVLIKSATLRKTNAENAHREAKKLTWQASADKSFLFFKDVYQSFKYSPINNKNQQNYVR
jgi:glycosyltransferase involved in cell wall biosynthesis